MINLYLTIRIDPLVQLTGVSGFVSVLYDLAFKFAFPEPPA